MKRYNDLIKIYESKERPIFDSPDIYSNIGYAYSGIGKYKEAHMCIDEALKIDAKNKSALFNKGVLLQNQKDFNTAIKKYLEFIKYFPENNECKNNLSEAYLSCLAFEEGWINYNNRWKYKNTDSNYLKTNLPLFNIEKRSKKTFIWREQGLGDEILFSTMYSDINKICDAFTVQVDQRMLPIFSRTYKEIEFVSGSEQINQNKYSQHLPIGDLGLYLRKSVKDFDGKNKIKLSANQELVKKFKEKMEAFKTPICGVSWKSNNKNTGKSKSITLSEILPILSIKNITFVSIQYGEVTDEINEINCLYNIKLNEFKEIDHFNDLESHIALIEACDFLVVSSNSTAHLCGALGKETFIMVPTGPSLLWYWNNNTANGYNIWYPTIKVYYQSKLFDWKNPVESIVRDILIKKNNSNN